MLKRQITLIAITILICSKLYSAPPKRYVNLNIYKSILSKLLGTSPSKLTFYCNKNGFTAAYHEMNNTVYFFNSHQFNIRDVTDKIEVKNEYHQASGEWSQDYTNVIEPIEQLVPNTLQVNSAKYSANRQPFYIWWPATKGTLNFNKNADGFCAIQSKNDYDIYISEDNLTPLKAVEEGKYIWGN